MLRDRASLPWLAAAGLLVAGLASPRSAPELPAPPAAVIAAPLVVDIPAPDPIDVANAVELSAQFTVYYPIAMTARDPDAAYAAAVEASKLDLALGGRHGDELAARLQALSQPVGP